MKNLGDVEKRVEGDGLVHVGGLHLADEGGVFSQRVGKLFLGQAFQLAVVRYFQAKLFVFVIVL